MSGAVNVVNRNMVAFNARDIDKLLDNQRPDVDRGLVHGNAYRTAEHAQRLDRAHREANQPSPSVCASDRGRADRIRARLPRPTRIPDPTWAGRRARRVVARSKP